VLADKIKPFEEKLKEKDIDLEKLNKIVRSKEKIIRNISIAHTQFKQELESAKDELLIAK